MEFLGTLFIISAPSGGGKTSLVNALIEQLHMIKVSVSHTTRAPRVGEVHGKNYFFVDQAEFEQYQADGVFLESATVFNHSYGTSKNWVLEQLQAGVDVILEIDWQGARRVKEQMPCVSIFILPPSREALLTRLEGRQQDSPEVIASRMEKASHEISHYSEYDYVIVNDNFKTALEDLVAVLKAQRVRTSIQKQRYAALFASLLQEPC
ncbi:MAG: guanylate kinase [Gammaproteobacteria bacterium 39-13]|nr:guanylate kinase [Gammaproteobacteria bacterium]OJV90489.1 MAG: guanylate kinase [Gammaproteobacteria bacterium 39-13]